MVRYVFALDEIGIVKNADHSRSERDGDPPGRDRIEARFRGKRSWQDAWPIHRLQHVGLHGIKYGLGIAEVDVGAGGLAGCRLLCDPQHESLHVRAGGKLPFEVESVLLVHPSDNFREADASAKRPRSPLSFERPFFFRPLDELRRSNTERGHECVCLFDAWPQWLIL